MVQTDAQSPLIRVDPTDSWQHGDRNFWSIRRIYKTGNNNGRCDPL